MKYDWEKLPKKFLERLELIIPPDQIDSVRQSFCQPKPITFRVNNLKISPAGLYQRLTKEGFGLERASWNPDTFILKNRSQKELMATQFYQEGQIYLQSLSSLVPALILDPKPGERVLDLCAAPGSKTTQMAALMTNRGEIYANDKSHIRNYKLRANLELQGVKIARVLQYPGEIFWKTFPEQFDKVLLDAPCSLEGRFQCLDPKTYQDWSTQKIKNLSEQQKWLLRSAISCTKVGGWVVYSTCTLSPEENEGVIDWILKKEKGTIDLEKIEIKGLETSPAILQWGQKRFNESLNKTFRIPSSSLMEGFFIAKIRKVKTNLKLTAVKSD